MTTRIKGGARNMTIEAEWLKKHETLWGLVGVRRIATDGVSPFAWDVPGDKQEIQRLARERVSQLCAV